MSSLNQVMDEFIIRPYKKEDREAVRNIAYKTAFMGDSAEVFFDDKEILADILTRYYTDYEPESCFVAENNGIVAGYIIGTKDASVFQRVFIFKIIPVALFKAVFNNMFLKRKNLIFILMGLSRFLRGEVRFPYFGKQYPANLHIDLDKSARNFWVGSRLMVTFLAYLIKEKIPGVHLVTRSEKAARFFERHGFHLLYKSKRSYFRHIIGRDVPYYFYVKELAVSPSLTPSH